MSEFFGAPINLDPSKLGAKLTNDLDLVQADQYTRSPEHTSSRHSDYSLVKEHLIPVPAMLYSIIGTLIITRTRPSGEADSSVRLPSVNGSGEKFARPVSADPINRMGNPAGTLSIGISR